MSENRRIAIMGGSECGKTSLAIAISRGLWTQQKLRTLAFDPFDWEHTWGPQAWVTNEFHKFVHVVFRIHKCAVSWDEGTDNGGRDSDNTKFFTGIRHYHPFFTFVGHDYAAMLPRMRTSLTDVILFKQDEDNAKKWAGLFTDKELLRSTALDQYVAIHKRAFRPARLLQVSKAQIESAGGVTL